MFRKQLGRQYSSADLPFINSYLLSISPDDLSAESTFRKCYALARLERFMEAIQALDLALKAGTVGFEALFFKATILQMTNREGQALQWFDAAIAINPDHVESLLSRAYILRKNGDLKQALKDINRAVKLLPNYPEAVEQKYRILEQTKDYETEEYQVLASKLYVQRGMKFFFEQNLPEASQAAISSLMIDDESVQARLLPVLVDWRRGNLSLALDGMKGIIARYGYKVNICIVYYHLLIFLGCPDFALFLLQTEGTQWNPESAELYKLLASASLKYSSPREKVQNACNAALQLQQECSQTFLIKTQMYIQYGEYDNAMKMLEEINPSQVPSYALLRIRCLLMLKLNKRSQCLEFLERLIRVNNESAYRVKAWILADYDEERPQNTRCAKTVKKNREEALRCLEQVIKIDPGDYSIYKFRGKILSKLGRFHEAISDFNKCVKTSWADSELYFCKAHSQLMVNLKSEALKTCIEGGRLNFTSRMLALMAGCVLMSLKRTSEAYKMFAKLRQGSPDDPCLHLLLILASAGQSRFDEAFEQMKRFPGEKKYELENIRAMLHLRLGNPEEGSQAAKRAVQSNQMYEYNAENAQSYLLLAVAAIRMNECQSALEYLSTAGNWNASLLDLHYRRGQAYTKMGLLSQAIAEYNAEVENYPNRPASIIGRGVCQALLGFYRQAISDLNSIDKEHPIYTIVVAAISFLKGDFHQSKQMLQHFTKIYNNAELLSVYDVHDIRMEYCERYYVVISTALRSGTLPLLFKERVDEIVKQLIKAVAFCDDPSTHETVCRLYLEMEDVVSRVKLQSNCGNPKGQSRPQVSDSPQSYKQATK